MLLKVKNLFWISLPTSGIAVGFITSIACFLNIVDLIDFWINFDERKPSYHIFALSDASVQVIKWEILGYSLFLISGLLLIIGTIKKSHRLLLPWLILSVYVILFGIGSIVAFSVLSFGNMDNRFGYILLFVGLGLIFVTGLCVYIWIGILSLYRKIREKNRIHEELEAEKLEAEKLYQHPQVANIVKSTYHCECPPEQIPIQI
ncbi:uncharacterized protein LOC129921121 [Episyrphus balteatus]|uniref:uncharacterized protein LOC129921121 n=1 Tax=Episyrphus balteatus TaxID=286459 RepID=UPI0024867755|nr:uncharacterized protein LOC129921121 [Episyrphus balteatus]XP_055858784.1 uncharacterized protein LOC129921121 [Episyrphus balteatus]